MRIKITIDAKNMTLPRNYLHMLQGVIYDNLPSSYANEIHENNCCKRFNFSLLNGRFLTTRIPNTKEDLIIFLDKAEFYISCIEKDFIILLCQRLSMNGYIMLGNYCAKILKIEDETKIIRSNKINVECLSPITIHKTIDNRTIYYNPFDSEFFDLLNNNLKRKLNLESDEFISFTNVKNVTKVLSKYKGFIIEAYKLECSIEANSSILNDLMDVGLGDRNSYGFGMLKLLHNML